jgi:hypothetical protein
MKKILLVILSVACLSVNAQTPEKKVHSLSLKKETTPSPVIKQSPNLFNSKASDEEMRIKGEKFSRNTFYVNILGPTIPASFNFERIITKNGLINFGVKVGGFYLPIAQYNDLKLANGSIEANMIVGRRSHLFVMSFGWAGHYGSFFNDKQERRRNYFIPTSTFGMHYRFQKPSHSMFFQLGFTTNTLLAFASDDLVEMAVGNAVIYGMDFLFGKKPNFGVPSIGIGYSF